MYSLRKWILFIAVVLWRVSEGVGATVTVQSTRLGSTPESLAYNSGHFVPGSNTADWWRYAGMSGARLFISPSLIEPNDDIPGHGDGVTDQASFLNRKAALRADPLSPSYINWAYVTNGYRTTALHGSNLLNVNHAAANLRRLGVNILVNIGASVNDFPITGTNDWAGKWELWQHFYAQAFYLGREFDVERYQMFNEPDHSSAGGLTLTDYLQRLQLASDAIQCAGVDVNQRYAKSLNARLLAPVTAGSVSTTYNTWGRNIVTNRHLNFLGQTDTNFWLIGQYDYHEYNSTPATFGSRLAGLHSSLAADMSPEARFPTSISEFNVHTASMFNTLTETLDSPSKYARFGAIVVNLANNFCNELYCFKFSQTLFSDTVPIKKNGMHYVDNTNAPYNIGGITKAGEAWRLFSKAVSPGRERLGVGQGATALHVTSTFDPLTKRYHLFSANESSSVDLTLDIAAWNLPAGQRVLLEEVSEDCHGSARSLLTVAGNQLAAGLHGSNTVWMFSLPSQHQQPLETVFAAADATLVDGANRGFNFGTNVTCPVKNNSTNTSHRSAALVKFRLPTIYLPDIQFALLTVRASAVNPGAKAQAHVYGLTNHNWSEGVVTWSNAPGLLQNVGAGISYTNNYVRSADDSAQMVGQIVADQVAQDRMVDVTRFIKEQGSYNASFLLTRDVRYHGDVADQSGMTVVAREADTNAGPRLLLVRSLDTDGDGISDDAEINVFGTNPRHADTDGDGETDGEEILVQKTDPGTYASVAPYILNQPAGHAARVGDTVMLQVSALGTQPLSYQWFFNITNAISGATNSALTLPDVQVNQSGFYHVLVSNAVGIVLSSNALLEVTNSVSPGAALVYDPFDYPNGTTLAGQGGWLLNGGTSGSIEAGNLFMGGLPTAPGNRFTWPGTSMSVRLPIGDNTSGTVFFSFAMRVDDLGSLTGEGTLAGFASGADTLFGTKINIRTNGAGGFQLGTSKGPGTTFGNWASNHFSVGETVFVVGRYTFRGNGDDTCDLWLNPRSETFARVSPPTADVAEVGQGGTDLAQIDRFFFRSASGSTGVGKLVADELRVGLSWSSVTPVAPIRLNIAHGGNGPTLSWPVEPAGFFVERTDNVSTRNWASLTNVPQTNGSTQSIVVVDTNPVAFFRLGR